MTDLQPNSDEADSLRVLLIEDNPGDARLFEEYLEESSVEATCRHESTLEAGLEALREETPDVLALDLGLPDSEGTETVAAATEAAPKLPIVVLTGQDDLGVALQVQEAGAAEYLQKGELTPALVGRTLRWAVRQDRMQRKLRQRDAWIRSITESLSAGVFRCGPTGRIEYANEALANMLGFESDEELIGRDLTEFYADPYDRGRVLAEEGAEGAEVEFERKGGGVFTGLLNAEVAYDAQGKPVHFDGTITDITEQKEEERELRVLSEAAQQAKESILITEGEPLDEPGPRIEYVNAACERMTGYSEEELLGKTPRILQGEETDRDVLDSLRAALEAGEAWQGETVNYRKDGTPYRVQWNVAPVTDENGEITRWVSVQRDVTEERKREERLRFLARALDQVGEKVVITDPSGEIQYANDAFEELTGYSEEEVLGETPALLNSGEHGEAFYEELWATIQSGETFQGEFVNEKKDGTQYVEEEAISPVMGEEGEVTHFVSAGRDVTNRKERAEELRRSRDLLHIAGEMTGVGGWTTDLREGPPYQAEWTEKLYDIFGLSREEDPPTEEVFELYHPEDRDRHREAVRRATETGEGWDQELRLAGEGGALKEGAERWVRNIGRPVLEDGEVVEIQGAIQDITDRKRRERHIEWQNDLFRKAQEIANVGGWEYEVESGHLTWTEQVYEIHGLPSEQDPKQDPTVEEAIAAYHPDDQPKIEEALGRAIREKTPYDLELRLIPQGGSQNAPEEEEVRWVRTRGEPVIQDGEVVSVRGTIQDITDQKEAEEEIRSTKDYYEQILNQVPIDLAVFTPEAEFEYMNPESVSDPDTRDWLMGRTNEEYFREHREDPEVGQARDESIRQAAQEKKTVSIEETIQGEEGLRHFMRVHGPLTDLEGKVTNVVAFGIDITERKRREEHLREAKEEAERMNRLKSAFLANMSHEIRTPLTSILGFAEAIGEQVRGASSAEEIDTSMLSEFSALIEKSGRRLMETLTSVLELSKLEAGEMDLSAEPMDLAKEAEETVGELRPQAEEAGIELTSDLEGPAWAEVDEGGLHIILRNLLSNAIKYTETGGQVWVRTRAGENLSVLEVEDTGIGMDPDKTSELFEAFKQESEGTNREYEGTGLGLTLVKEVLGRMGGSIEVETQKEEGSRFTVRLPRSEHPGEA